MKQVRSATCTMRFGRGERWVGTCIYPPSRKLASPPICREKSFMDKRPLSPEDEPEETRGALDWLLQHMRFSYLLGVEPKEHQRGVLQYWPFVVVLLSVVAVHATLDDNISVLPPFNAPRARAGGAGAHLLCSKTRLLRPGPLPRVGPRNNCDSRSGCKRVPPGRGVARRADA